MLEEVFLSPTLLDSIEDRQLAAEAQKEPQAFEKLYEKYKKRVFDYFFYRTSHCRELSEEMMQETFVRAFGALERFEFRRCTYLSYLMTIARHLLANHYRSKKTISLESLPEIADQSQSLVREAEVALLWQCIDRLPKMERRVLRLKYKEDLPIKAIAAQVGKSENAVKLILSRARKRLRQEAG